MQLCSMSPLRQQFWEIAYGVRNVAFTLSLTFFDYYLSYFLLIRHDQSSHQVLFLYTRSILLFRLKQSSPSPILVQFALYFFLKHFIRLLLMHVSFFARFSSARFVLERIPPAFVRASFIFCQSVDAMDNFPQGYGVCGSARFFPTACPLLRFLGIIPFIFNCFCSRSTTPYGKVKADVT